MFEFTKRVNVHDSNATPGATASPNRFDAGSTVVLQLIDLNDDCLSEILERLNNIDDLCSAAATCTRLNCVAYQIWERRHRNKSLNFEQILRKHGANGHTQIIRYLTNFGELLSSIEFTLTDEREWQQLSQMNYDQARCNDLIFAKMVTHCADTLEALEMRGIALSVPRTMPGQAAFVHLKKLKLDYCIDLKCYAYASKLQVDWYFNKAYVFLRHLAGSEALEHLEISQMLLTKEFLMILGECRHLKVLKLSAIRDDHFCSEVAFAQWLENLKNIVDLELVIEYFDADFPNSASVFLNHIGSAETVEQLYVCGGEANDELMRGLLRFGRLRKLTLGHFTNFTVEHFDMLDNVGEVTDFTMTAWNQMTPDDLVVIINKMERLDRLRLQIVEYEEIDEAVFVSIAVIYRRRNRKLIIEHTEQILTWNIDHELLEENCNFVDFREIYL